MPSSLTYLISGANRGIGKGFVALLLQRPSTTVIAGVRDPSTPVSKSLANLPKATDSKLILVKIDSSIASDAATAISSLQNDHNIRAVDVVVANAGVGGPIAKVIDVSAEVALDHFAVNSVGPVTLVSAAVPLLKASKKVGGPVFMAVSSTLGSIGMQETVYKSFSANIAPYGASKAAMNWFIHRLHLEEPWLTSFVCHPGVVRTDMTGDMDSNILDAIGAITVEESVGSMMMVVDAANRENTSGNFRSYDGSTLPW
ncbi:aflatoxin biosynthesis ketoreductase nor-1 protein [Colletotrichum incanum]|uniref:Aflatoxin biosynthesis ketoreductase nor-1 protein n=1 Tax=Colletotrichum incanum TaxID=1573173 RepID=A0A167CE13_COLIC|nr:aflatoxin biosynthesis ketoreductase nor-1 protein [Colletotrichum incanum]OHW97994.1 aflatoxin biosynthesis ketoreductase nor-1 [Colletotrichum incanum]